MADTNTVTASAPGKLLLFGEHAVVYGHPCIVTAVDQRIFVSVRRNGVNVFHLEAPDMGLAAYSKTIADLGKKELPKEVQFVEMLYKRFLETYPQREGIVVTTKSDFSSQFGFGSSSAVTVAFAKALTALYGVELTPKELFDLCYQAVLDVQGVGSGFDIAAAIWGGTLYYVPPARVVEPLDAAQLSLVVGYTGVKADTPTLVRMVRDQRARDPAAVDGIFSLIADVVSRAREALAARDWQTLGKLMTENQNLLRTLHVSSAELERLIEVAEGAGAYGAKLSGAGGGDCMIAVATREQNGVNAAIEQVGGKIVGVRLHAEGVRIEV